ncbi:HIRAN domain-containing protein [Sediminitomix flava]|nr:HIRAN domain-containing protein [Sediminitomix flava]
MFNWNSSYLKREKDNPYNAKAIAIYFEDYKLGFVPRNENDELSKFCDQGYSKVFEVRINRFPPEEHPENQISIVVHLMHFKDL